MLAIGVLAGGSLMMRIRLLVVLVVALVGCGSSGDSDPARPASADDRSAPASEPPVVALSVEPRMPADARTHIDRKDRLRVKLPADWRPASDRATDRISPVEGNLLAVGTFPIRPRPEDACSDDVAEPRVDVGPTDAMVVVEEDVRAPADLARTRPRFRLLKQVAPPGEPRRARTGVFPAWNCRNQVGISGLWETSFSDRGRVFSVTAIVGKAATEKTRRETLAVLNSLKPLED